MATLQSELDDAMTALTAGDAEHLEAVEQRVRTMTLAQLAGMRRSLPEIAAKNALLGQMLTATAANLKVLVSVLQIEARMEMR